jgi:hypothetical protein
MLSHNHHSSTADHRNLSLAAADHLPPWPCPMLPRRPASQPANQGRTSENSTGHAISQCDLALREPVHTTLYSSESVQHSTAQENQWKTSSLNPPFLPHFWCVISPPCQPSTVNRTPRPPYQRLNPPTPMQPPRRHRSRSVGCGKKGRRKEGEISSGSQSLHYVTSARSPPLGSEPWLWDLTLRQQRRKARQSVTFGSLFGAPGKPLRQVFGINLAWQRRGTVLYSRHARVAKGADSQRGARTKPPVAAFLWRIGSRCCGRSNDVGCASWRGLVRPDDREDA